MKIDNRIIKAYLKNVYFITGTAYAGKSTICKMIADRLGHYHCEENYRYDYFLSLTNPQDYPHMNYFKTMKNWQEFVSRSPDEYRDWIFGVSRELAPFEIAELISVSKDQKVIVDTNLPLDILKKITDYDHVAVLLTNQEQSVDDFFKRDDPEKQFLLKEIQKCHNPEKIMNRFREGLRLINGQEVIQAFTESGFKCFWRKDSDSLEDRYQAIIKHLNFK